MKRVRDIDLSNRKQSAWHGASFVLALVIGFILMTSFCTVPAKASETVPPDASGNTSVVNLKTADNELRCHGNRASTRQDTWGMRTVYGPPPTPVDPVPPNYYLQQSAGLRCWFCPNNPPGPADYTNLVMPLKLLYCVTPYDHPPAYYQGVTLDPNIWDIDGHDTNPGKKNVRNSNDQICRWQRILPRKRDWMLMSMAPRYSVWNEIRLAGPIPNMEHWFRWKDSHKNSHTVKPIEPGNDAVMKPLHRIPKVR